MTTPPQPQNKTSHTSNHHNTTAGSGTNNTTTTTTGRSRKRPAPGTSAPISSIPAVTTTAPSPSLAGPDMSYLGLPQASSPRLSSSSVAPGANLYATVPNLVDSYRTGQTATSSQPIAGANDANSQIALINRGTNTLIRMPYATGPAGIPQMGASAAQMGMMGVGTGGIGLGQVIGQPGQGPDGMDPFDRDLQMRIDKMRKKRATIPPFVQKLSSFVNDPKTDALIRWSPSGNSFLVLDEDEFSKTLIPDLFKHNNYASFVRQLNMYGFHKVVGLADGSLKTSEQRSKPPSEYENPYFKRGQPDLMWLISKPKGKGPKRKNAKKNQDDSDNVDDLSDGGEGEFGDGGGGRGYIEGPKTEGQSDGHHQQSGGRNTRPDIQAVIQQLEAVRNHQAMISAAINRLRKDHNQLYEQSVAFQTLHDRHENSINAILSFLATVYDKSLSGNISGTFSNLFQNQVEHIQPLHPQGVGAVVGNTGGAIVTPRQGQRAPANTMTRRRQLLLENGPMAGQIQISEEDSPKPQTSPVNKPNGQNMKSMGSPVIQNYQTYQSPSIQELNPPLSQDNSRQEQQYQGTHQQPYPNIFSLPDSPVGPLPSPNLSRPSASPVSSHSMTPRLFARSLVTPGLSSQTLQDHNAQLAAKAREIEELEELQTAQTHHVDELMDMMNKFADTDSGANSGSHMNGGTSNGLDGSAGSIDEFLNWGIPSDLNGDGSMGNGFSGVDGDVGQPGLDGVDDLNALFSFHPNGTENGDGGMGASLGVGDGGLGKVLGTNPSTVVTSPAGSTASRAREELEEEVEEVAPKRRRLGVDDDLGNDLEDLLAVPVKTEEIL